MRVPIRLSSPSKYRSRRTGGYASGKEAHRAAELALLAQLGEIRDLQQQVTFELVPRQGSRRAVSYRADFCYEQRQPDGSWARIVEDVKGFQTPVYRLKKRLMEWRHGIKIQEV